MTAFLTFTSAMAILTKLSYPFSEISPNLAMRSSASGSNSSLYSLTPPASSPATFRNSVSLCSWV